MAKPAPTPPRIPGSHFRGEIERAEAGGVSREAMALHLTLADASKLKRDPGLAVTDIGFADGVMRFLGVKVVEGGVGVSVLNYPAA